MIPVPSQLDSDSLERSVSRFKPFVQLEDLRRECEGQDVLVELLDQVLSGALRYAESICIFNQILIKHKGVVCDEQGERAEIEAVRSSIHDAFIADVNILARTMRKFGKNVSWCDALGGDRSRYGRLSLTLSFEILKQKA